MSKATILEDLLGNFLNEATDLFAALVVDLEGFVIAKQSVKILDEELIGAIMTILEQTISRIKRYTETSFGSGTFDTNEFQLFYIELSKIVPAIFVLVADPYSNLNQYIPYSYIVAEKISLILNNQDTPINIPRLDNGGKLVLESDNESNTQQKNIQKIVVIGPEQVGKTTLVNMYCYGTFQENYKPTIGISIIEKNLQISRDFNLAFHILDLGGLKSFAKIRRFYYRYSNAILLLFDYERIETFNNIVEWIEESRQFASDESVPIILIGNKIDLIENHGAIRKRAEDLAKQYKFPFFETSALTGQGIDELFTYLISNLF